MTKEEQNKAIQQEYMQKCVELGNVEYQLSLMRQDVADMEYRAEKIVNAMKSINKRGAALANGEELSSEQNESGSEVAPI